MDVLALIKTPLTQSPRCIIVMVYQWHFTVAIFGVILLETIKHRIPVGFVHFVIFKVKGV